MKPALTAMAITLFVLGWIIWIASAITGVRAESGVIFHGLGLAVWAGRAFLHDNN